MLTAAIFVAFTLGSLALLLALVNVFDPSRARLRRRLAGEFVVAVPGQAYRLYKDVDALEKDEAPAAKSKHGPSPGHEQALRAFLREAGVTIPPRRLAMYIGALAVTAIGVGFLLVGPFLAAVLGIAAVVVPIVVLFARRTAMRAKYVKQLAGAFELMGRVLRAGQPVPEAFRAAIKSFGNPLSGEFERCLHQVEHGLRPEAAYRELSERAGVIELRLFVAAMTIQRQTGGNLSEVLDRIATVIRSRLQLKQKIRALTAEGRMQSATLVALPFLTFGVMYVLNRQYAEQLLVQWKLLLATLVLMLVGVVWIRNIMKFEG